MRKTENNISENLIESEDKKIKKCGKGVDISVSKICHDDINQTSKLCDCPNSKDISIAIIGINEYRNSSFSSNKYEIDKFRIEFYSLFIGNWNVWH